MAFQARAVAAIVVTLVSVGCSKNNGSPTTPSCSFSVTLGSTTFAGAGGTGSATVTAAVGCAWTAASEAEWITITSANTGSSSGTVSFSVAAYSGDTSRTGTLRIAGQPLTLTQGACEVGAKQADLAFADAASQATLDIDADAGCAWSLADDTAWVTVDPAAGSGPGQVVVRVAENSGDAREAELRLNGRAIRVRQSPEPCRPEGSLSPSTFPAEGGNGVLRVRAGGSCTWRIDTSAAPWLTLLDDATGTGAAERRVAVSATTDGAERRGIIGIDSARVEVIQGGRDACTFEVQPVLSLAPSAGGVGTFTVNTSPACEWTVDNSHPFVRVATGTRRGPATVRWEIDRNPETYVIDFRKADLQVRWDTPTRGQNVWLWQFGDCRTAVMEAHPGAPMINELVFDASGGTRPLWTLTESPFTCPWRVEGGADWVTITPFARLQAPGDPPEVRRGDGDVKITVAPNPSAQQRRVTILIGERPLSIVQAGR